MEDMLPEEDTLKANRFLMLLLALVVAVVAAACGASDDEDTATSAAEPAASSAPAASTEAPAASTEAPAASTEAPAASTEAPAASSEAAAGPAIKVGLATDQGGLNDKGFNQLAYEGAKKAEAELGITLEVRESKSETDYVPNLTYFCQNEFDMVIAIGFLMAQAVADVSKQCPDAQFAIVDNSVSGDPINEAANVTGLLFKEQETGYLVGYLAGLIQTQDGFKGTNGKNTVSSVGGLEIPPVVRFIAGYQQGVKDASPGATTINGYSQDFVDQAKCKELALSQIGQGASVVFQVAGGCGLGALEAAAEKGVWGIGVDADQSALGAHILTSAVKRVDSAVFLAIQAAQGGTLAGGTDVTYGLAEDGVALGTVSPDVPAELVDQVTAKAEEIKSGSLVPPTEIPA